jgi:sulfur transfer complex TusBCD TusB component (DsrH family)
MASILIAFSSSPETPAGRHALKLAESLAAAGHTLTLCCLQDAALLGSDRAPAEARTVLDGLLDRGARCMALLDDLTLRGLQAGARAETVDHAGLIAVLTADHHRVVGAF